MEFKFETTIKLSMPIVRETLSEVRDLLLRHEINGGNRKFKMDTVCEGNGCGTAACIGGWASILLLGFEGAGTDYRKREIVSRLFGSLIEVDRQADSSSRNRDRLWKLFYGFDHTQDYNKPNVAATAIQRYLDGKIPWPKGKMPEVLRYKRKR